MSIYSVAESGTKHFSSRFSKSISNRMLYDCRFHELIPVLKRFVLPGDVWRIGGNALVRFQPMLTPTLTSNTLRVRYFFVPLRLLDENAELIITGSKNGKLFVASQENPLPTFKNFVADANKIKYPNSFIVTKYSFWDYMNIQCGDYESINTAESLPAQYWDKGAARIWYDYYRDENLQADDDFDTWYETRAEKAADNECFFSNLSKDYFMSALPWQLKGIAPAITTQQDGTFTASWNPNFNNWSTTPHAGTSGNYGNVAIDYDQQADTYRRVWRGGADSSVVNGFNTQLKNYLNSAQNVSGNITVSSMSFDAADERTMFAITRIMERLARTGSRYIEYLRANFGVAPADETLQRPKYLGGWKLPIVTTEVLQTAADGDNPVGTMRGHGITRGGNQIDTFYANEFGILFGFAEVRPKVQYTTGIPRQFSYKRRFDFFNPSFQHLSEQETRNAELFVDFEGVDNDDTFGFQAYANELRSSQDEVVGDMRDNLSYWNQGIKFNSRPNLNSALISGKSHLAAFNAPFAVNGVNARPIIVDFYNIIDVYRPMVRYSTPGLVDHL